MDMHLITFSAYIATLWIALHTLELYKILLSKTQLT